MKQFPFIFIFMKRNKKIVSKQNLNEIFEPIVFWLIFLFTFLWLFVWKPKFHYRQKSSDTSKILLVLHNYMCTFNMFENSICKLTFHISKVLKSLFMLKIWMGKFYKKKIEFWSSWIVIHMWYFIKVLNLLK